MFCSQVSELLPINNSTFFQNFHSEETVVVYSANQKHLSERSFSDQRNQLEILRLHQPRIRRRRLWKLWRAFKSKYRKRIVICLLHIFLLLIVYIYLFRLTRKNRGGRIQLICLHVFLISSVQSVRIEYLAELQFLECLGHLLDLLH